MAVASQRRAGEKPYLSRSFFKAIIGETSGSLFGSHTLRTEGGVDANTGQGKGSSFWFYSAAGAEVEVDTETGKVRVLTCCQRRRCRQSDSSTTVQFAKRRLRSGRSGLGAVRRDALRQRPADQQHFSRLPAAVDARSSRRISIAVGRNASSRRPFGAKGMGEAALPPMAPAIGNAVANALNGVRVRDLPMKPEKLFAAIEAAKPQR